MYIYRIYCLKNTALDAVRIHNKNWNLTQNKGKICAAVIKVESETHHKRGSDKMPREFKRKTDL